MKLGMIAGLLLVTGCSAGSDVEPDVPIVGPLDYPALFAMKVEVGADADAADGGTDEPQDIVATTGLCLQDNITSQVECESYACEAGTCYAWDEQDGSNLTRCEAQEDCKKGFTCGFCVSLADWRGTK